MGARRPSTWLLLCRTSLYPGQIWCVPLCLRRPRWHSTSCARTHRLATASLPLPISISQCVMVCVPAIALTRARLPPCAQAEHKIQSAGVGDQLHLVLQKARPEEQARLPHWPCGIILFLMLGGGLCCPVKTTSYMPTHFISATPGFVCRPCGQCGERSQARPAAQLPPQEHRCCRTDAQDAERPALVLGARRVRGQLQAGDRRGDPGEEGARSHAARALHTCGRRAHAWLGRRLPVRWSAMACTSWSPTSWRRARRW